jgi:adenosylcobinamide-GDP ribazoletransferase
VNAQWRLFLAALGWVTHGTPASTGSRFVPVVGICIGLIAAAVYWGAAQLWPTSLAVVLSMLAAALLTVTRTAPSAGLGALYWVFVLFLKYNALMALSAASVPLPLPPYCALGLIMVAAQAASRGLVVSVMATGSPTAPLGTPQVSTADLLIALSLGLAPAALLGIPGLIGLVAAILMRLALPGYVLGKFRLALRERLEVVQSLTEVTFYLGALASWKYV